MLWYIVCFTEGIPKMKEMYFNRKTIARRGAEFLLRIGELRDRSHYQLRPEKCALLITDMQRYFLNPRSHAFVPSGPAIVPHLTEMARRFTEKGLMVVLTRHVNDDQNARQMKNWWSDLITSGNPLSMLHPEFVQINAPVVTKTQYDSFHRTNLQQMLDDKGIEQLIVGGVMTHLCCETTARSAFVRGYEVFFGIDFTATYNKDFHLSSLLNISHGFGVPVLFKEVLETVENEEAS
jgi:isochorismate hydrolase